MIPRLLLTSAAAAVLWAGCASEGGSAADAGPAADARPDAARTVTLAPPPPPRYGDGTCPVNRPATPDLLDEALKALGLDRCRAVFAPSVKVPASIWKDPYRLPFYDRVHDAALNAPTFARHLTAALDRASAAAEPVTRNLLIARQLAGFSSAVTVAPTPAGRTLARALAELSAAAGGRPDRQAIAKAAAALPAGLAAALVPIADAIAAGLAARARALRDLALPAGITPEILHRYAASLALRAARPGAALDPRKAWVKSLLLGGTKGFHADEIYRAAIRLAFAVERANLARFAGVKARLDLDTPAGRVVVRGPGADTYEPGKGGAGAAVLLLLDTGGDDTYRIPAGATASGKNAVSVLVDLGGRDTYGYVAVPRPQDKGLLPSDEDGRAPDGDRATGNGPISLSETSRQGAGRLGIGLLFDLGAGADRYTSLRMSQGFGALGVGALYDAGGDDRYRAEAGAQGAGIFGIGLLIDRRGRDRYDAFHQAQGYAYVKGIGVLHDAAGDDVYHSDPGDPAQGGNPLYLSAQLPGKGNSSFTQGAAFGRRADFTDRVFMSGGVGVLRDVAGDDRYTTSVFGQGTGFWFGTGILADGAGNDSYDGLWYVQGATAHYALSVFEDAGGNDRYNQTLKPRATSIGVGHDFSVSFHIDGGGDDRYRAPGLSLGSGNENGMGFMVNLGGDDRYETRGSRTLGAAPISKGSASGGFRTTIPCVGVFIDAGGKDTYLVDDKPSPREGTTWRYKSAHTVKTRELGVGLDRAAGTVVLP